MSGVSSKSTNKQPLVLRFERHLNGPLGKKVLDNLEEGESFLLQTSEHTLKVTKQDGRATVRLVSSLSPTLQ